MSFCLVSECYRPATVQVWEGKGFTFCPWHATTTRRLLQIGPSMRTAQDTLTTMSRTMRQSLTLISQGRDVPHKREIRALKSRGLITTLDSDRPVLTRHGHDVLTTIREQE